jgi:hypothetical protein
MAEISKRYQCKEEGCGAEVIVTKKTAGALCHCNHEMKEKVAGVKMVGSTTSAVSSAGTKLGKRYKCARCDGEALCTIAGKGKLICCGEEMHAQEARPIPGSD